MLAYAEHMPDVALPNARPPVRHARLFRNGRNQAVRIPRDFELAAEEVVMYREEDRLIIQPLERQPSLAEVLSRLSPLNEDFGPIDDPPVSPEAIL